MATNVKKVWASGKAVVNAWLAIPSGFSAEVIAQCGFDSVTVDMQHGVQDYLSMMQCFQAMHAHPVTPMVRVPWNEPGIIGKVLDGGAYGVICPMINSKEEAENFVSYCKYPPRGTRSNGPIRSGMYGTAGTYQVTANDETLCIPMMETRTAIENMESILDVEGIAGVYVGPSDLGFSYGLVPKLDREEPEILKIYDKLIRQSNLKNVHLAPYTLRVASIFAVLSRLEASKKAGMSLMKKLRLYDGEDVEDFKIKDVKELQEESVREGIQNICPAALRSRLSSSGIKPSHRQRSRTSAGRVSE